jgi:hypothetical protein
VTGLAFFLELDPFPLEPSEPVLDEALLAQIVRETPAGRADAEVAVAVLELVRDDLACASTDGGDMLNDAQMALAIRALAEATKRGGTPLLLPFHDHSGWWRWSAEQGAETTKTRLTLLNSLFEPTSSALQNMAGAGSL